MPGNKARRGKPKPVGRTGEGRKVFQGSRGRFSEKSLTVTNPRINKGQPTNIPTVSASGRVMGEKQAAKAVIRAGGKDPVTGRKLRGHGSIKAAVNAAKRRSSAIGKKPRKR